MKPFIKWPGGKTEELDVILDNVPKQFDRYFEPFVGGGAVYLGIDTHSECFINDKSSELISLYLLIKNQNEIFYDYLNLFCVFWQQLDDIVNENQNELISIYDLYRTDRMSNIQLEYRTSTFIKNQITDRQRLPHYKDLMESEQLFYELKRNLLAKMKRTKLLETKNGSLPVQDIILNLETGIKSGFYMYIRYLYNNIGELGINPEKSGAIFYFIREYCYSSMFRYNEKGKFNVPYGGISYNKKNLCKKLDVLKEDKIASKLSNTNIYSLDFEEFLSKFNQTQEDFIFFDPPYDSDFSMYANNSFDKKDQLRLSGFCEKTKAKFLLVIKKTDFIYDLYKQFNISSFEKKYSVSFQNRNNRNTEHLIVTNY